MENWKFNHIDTKYLYAISHVAVQVVAMFKCSQVLRSKSFLVLEFKCSEDQYIFAYYYQIFKIYQKSY